MSIIRKKVTDDGITGYCHNKKCDVYNEYQGANGLEDEHFKCIVCSKLVHTIKEVTK